MEPIQTVSPASLGVQVLQEILDANLPRYTFFNLCAGTDGATPYIESQINGKLAKG